MVAQKTNPHLTAAPGVFQLATPITRDILEFLFVRQNLARVKTADHTGTDLVKAVNSTHTRIHYQPMNIPTMDFLMHSAHTLFPRRTKPAKIGAKGHLQVQFRANGIVMNFLSLISSLRKCRAAHHRTQ